MLELITLGCISSIFSHANIEVSSFSKMIYINCLMHHFSKMEATEKNMGGFELTDTEIDYKKYKKNFDELAKAGVVIVNFNNNIVFSPLWIKSIDKSRLIKEKRPAITKKQLFECISGDVFTEMICMKYKIDKEKTIKLARLFVLEQFAVFSESSTLVNSEFKNHFKNWVKYQIEEKLEPTIKSKGKILAR